LEKAVPAGEFEHQSAVMLGCNELLWDHPEVFIAVVRAAHHSVPLIGLISNERDFHLGEALLRQHNLLPEAVRFVVLSVDTMWARDYGPFFARPGRVAVVDAEYSPADGLEDRLGDDAAPKSLAAGLRLPVAPLPLRIEGGNLLTNGQGLCVATTALVERNLGKGHDPASIERLLRQRLGIRHLVYVNQLAGEETGHVDMFLTFLAPDCVVVAQCDPEVDAENARRLDETAETLSRVQTDFGPMRVHRVPMPPTTADGAWRTYTNVIFANGVLIVPTYSGVEPALQRKALGTCRRLLPGWDVVGVSSDVLAAKGGGLHCISLNVPGFVSAGRLFLQARPPERPPHNLTDGPAFRTPRWTDLRRIRPTAYGRSVRGDLQTARPRRPPPRPPIAPGEAVGFTGGLDGDAACLAGPGPG
jgi:agmatine/peptidylarginine deiminase